MDISINYANECVLPVYCSEIKKAFVILCIRLSDDWPQDSFFQTTHSVDLLFSYSVDVDKNLYFNVELK